MKTNVLKAMIKDAVKEAIQEELKDILLEAIKSPKPQINESYIPPVNIGNKDEMVKPKPNEDYRAKYADIMGAVSETQMSFNSQDIAPINPAGVDPINGNLPNGSVSLDQINQLLK